METAAQALKRFKEAEGRREQWRSILQDAYDVAIPNKQTFTERAKGSNRAQHLYDSTAVEGVDRFASRIMSAMSPPWMQWSKLVAGSDIPEDDLDRVNEALEEATDILFDYINHSDFTSQVNESHHDLAISTGVLLIEEGNELYNEPLLKFTSIPLPEFYPGSPNARGLIETGWRKHKIPCERVPQFWPEAKMPDELIKLIEVKPETEVEIIDGIIDKRTNDGMIFEQYVIWKKEVIFSQTMKESPLIVYRWSVTPGEYYGRGPIINQLANIRTANKVKEYILRNAAFAVSGVYTGVNDTIFNPFNAQIVPGGIIPVSSNATANPSLAALPRSGDFNVGDLVLKDLQQDINEALFASPLGDLTDPVRSATENILRNQEMLRNAGASFGRLKSEFAEPVVRKAVIILVKNGLIAPMKVDGKQVTLNMESPLAKAEAMDDFSNSQVWFSMVAQLPPEMVAASVKVEELPKYWADKLGVPASLVRSKEERDQIAKMAAEAAQQQIQTGGSGGQIQ
jgi:hypothetical protein